MGKSVIVACDFASAAETYAFLDELEAGLAGRDSGAATCPFVKIGMELYYAEGPAIVRALKARGCKVFLDLKLHDIPTTVGKACAVLGGLGADIVNVHAAGGAAMMRAAVAGAAKGAAAAGLPAPKVIAVTQLTSTDAAMLRDELLIERPLADVVSAYAKNAAAAGCAGVVCSAQEAAAVHATCGNAFLTVCPGVRLAEAVSAGEVQDQKRVMTPRAAREAGADYIVVGRPITQAPDPAAAYALFAREFCG